MKIKALVFCLVFSFIIVNASASNNSGVGTTNTIYIYEDTSQKQLPDISYNENSGKYLIVYKAYTSTNEFGVKFYDIWGIILNSDGTELKHFKIADASYWGIVDGPKAASIGDRWAVVFSYFKGDSSGVEIFMYDTSGKYLTDNKISPGIYRRLNPDIGATSKDNGFLVVWEELNNSGLFTEIRGRIVSYTGYFNSKVLMIGDSYLFNRCNPAVTQKGLNFFVVWEKKINSNETELEGRFISFTGTMNNVLNIARSKDKKFTNASVTCPASVLNDYLITYDVSAGASNYIEYVFATPTTIEEPPISRTLAAAGGIQFNSAAVWAGKSDYDYVVAYCKGTDWDSDFNIYARRVNRSSGADQENTFEIANTSSTEGSPEGAMVGGTQGQVVYVWDGDNGKSMYLHSRDWYLNATQIILLEGDLGFGDVTIGQNPQHTMKVHNDGCSALKVNSISCPSGFSASPQEFTVEPGGSQDVTITFSPTAAADYSGDITVNCNFSEGTNKLSCSGAGVTEPTRIIRLEGDLDFGNVTVGQSRQCRMKVYNDGDSTLSVTSISCPSGFTVDTQKFGIEADERKDVYITFSPTQVKSYSGNVSVSSNKTGGNSSRSCTGNGTAAPTRIIRLEGELSFVNVEVGQSSQLTMKVYNEGSERLTVNSISCPEGFSASPQSFGVNSGDSKEVTITFSPTIVKYYGGNITVDSDNTSGSETLECSGTVISAKPPKATSPFPKDGNKDYWVNILFSWDRETKADSYDFYLGTATDSLVKMGSPWRPEYNPGTLDSNTLYYWRVDTRNSTGATTGDVWNFRTMVFPPDKSNNLSPSDEAIDCSIDTDISWSVAPRATGYSVYFGTCNPPPFYIKQSETTFEPGRLQYHTTYYWRIDSSNTAGKAKGDTWSFTTECESLSKPIIVFPENNASVQWTDPILRWTNGGGATSYQVYLGTSPKLESKDFIGKWYSFYTSYYPGNLDYCTTYYWRVDANDGCGTVLEGDVWKFTTGMDYVAEVARLRYGDGAQSPYGWLILEVYPPIGKTLEEAYLTLPNGSELGGFCEDFKPDDPAHYDEEDVFGSEDIPLADIEETFPAGEYEITIYCTDGTSYLQKITRLANEYPDWPEAISPKDNNVISSFPFSIRWTTSIVSWLMIEDSDTWDVILPTVFPTNSVVNVEDNGLFKKGKNYLLSLDKNDYDSGNNFQNGSITLIRLTVGDPVVPNIESQEPYDANIAIENVGLKVGAISKEYSDTVGEGLIISQNPKANTKAIAGSAVNYVVSLGKRKIPNIVDMTSTAANTAITKIGLAVGTVTTAFSDTVAEGSVISQSPAAGTAVLVSSKVNYVKSLGKPVVPNVKGKTPTAANTAITAVGLKPVNGGNENSSTVAAGLVSSQVQVAGTKVNIGSTVTYKVSLGKSQSATVPNVAGLTTAKADAAIIKAGLKPKNGGNEYSNTVAAGLVSSQVQVAGTKVAVGSTVTYKVSLGKSATMPNVVGLTTAKADAAIKKAGLKPKNGGNEYSNTVAAGLVSSQVQVAGTKVAVGSTVTYKVSLGKSATMPNVVGLTTAKADAAIIKAGLKVGTVTAAYDNTIAVNSVISSDPIAGKVVAAGSKVNYIKSLGKSAAVPNIKGLTTAKADAAIKKAGLKVGTVTTANSNTVAAGKVISSSPIAGKTVAVGSKVNYVTSLGRAK